MIWPKLDRNKEPTSKQKHMHTCEYMLTTHKNTWYNILNTDTNTSIYLTHINTPTHVHTHARTHTHTYTHVNAGTYTHVNAGIYSTHTHTHTNIGIYSNHTHTHTHTHPHTITSLPYIHFGNQTTTTKARKYIWWQNDTGTMAKPASRQSP